MFLACQRGVVDEQLAMLPAKERLSYDEYKTYTPKRKPEPSIAWSDAFAGASAYLTDRDINRIEQEKNAPTSSNGLGDIFN